jgi:hypothetical protein
MRLEVIVALLMVCVAWSLLPTAQLVTLTRTPQKSGNVVVTLKPVGWMARAVKHRTPSCIREVVVLPSVLPSSSFFHDYFDDDHFCSRLCDGGLPVHVLTATPESLAQHDHDINRAVGASLRELFQSRLAAGIPASSICMIGMSLFASARFIAP